VCSHPWQPERWQAALDVADDRDPVTLQIDERRDDERERKHHEGWRHGSNETPDGERRR